MAARRLAPLALPLFYCLGYLKMPFPTCLSNIGRPPPAWIGPGRPSLGRLGPLGWDCVIYFASRPAP